MAGQDGLSELETMLRATERRQKEVEERTTNLHAAIERKQKDNAVEDLDLILGLLEAWVVDHPECIDTRLKEAAQYLNSLRFSLLS